MSSCLIFVDLWNELLEKDKSFPHTFEEYQNFIKYLNVVCTIVEEKGLDTFFISSNRLISESINTKNKVIIKNSSLLPETYENYFFCGLHYDDCVHRQAKDFSYLYPAKTVGICLNLTLHTPESFLTLNYFDRGITNYFWNRHGFYPIDIHPVRG